MNPTPRDVVVVADSTYGWPDDLWASDPPELFVSLGDLMAADIRALSEVAPVVGVYGNHCVRGYLDHSGIDLSQGTAAGLGQLYSSRVLGVSGCVRYKEDEHDVLYSQDEYSRALDQVHEPLDLVVAHCPPTGCNDHPDPAHVGNDALARLTERCSPRLLLHGHTYPDPPRTRTGQTEVLYVHGCWRGQIRI